MGTVTPTFRLIHMDNDKLQQQLDAIRAQYTDILPERLANIKNKWHQLLTAWTPSAAQELTNMCHSLAGSAFLAFLHLLDKFVQHAQMPHLLLYLWLHLVHQQLHYGLLMAYDEMVPFDY